MLMMLILFASLAAGSSLLDDIDETDQALFGAITLPIPGPELHSTSRKLMLPDIVISDFLELERTVDKFEEDLENQNRGNLLSYKSLREEWQKIEDAFLNDFKTTTALKAGPYFPQMKMLDDLEGRIFAIEKAILTRP